MNRCRLPGREAQARSTGVCPVRHDNQNTNYAYDAAGRLNKITYPDTNFVTALTDALGNVVERESYDAFGNTAGRHLTLGK